ncbi:cell wall anchored protein [Blastomyces gilchristii SLH14081]|uniref:Cell wall anchored protein n=1 Tax=Blastomyces gilchristii (strain SLH14081) TaxID=559298 RepID=A0A179UGB1_BLAGS|nr:cell wall anchored protein [Blastomyces gilchristii SLH14081]OAT06269.1 cell wall anchored protein [Blastomyces gilchristii SLH14081]
MMPLAYFLSHLSMPRLSLRFLSFALFTYFLVHNDHSYGVGVMGVAARAATPSSDRIYNRVGRDRIFRREDTPTDICKRWSQQTAVVNGTLYSFGGRSMTDSSQKDNTWNNDFMTLDLKTTWDISAPKLTGLPRLSGPPPVSNGYLWNSLESLYLYGGEYSDNPRDFPTAFSLWEYHIPSSSWKEHKNPRTSRGSNSNAGDRPVQRSAEGAGITVLELGRGFYFGGHLDGYTTEGWDLSVPRVYLKSFIEYTFPGFMNNDVESLKGDKPAGSNGAWRNITEGGLQESAGFTERADGVLVYVPGFGKHGVILGLAGGTNATFTQMNVIDVYDIETSMWYKQATSGETPAIRVNPCAVAASAADGSSTQVYLYAGQNLIPYGEQIQYDDMWILSIPSFTWIKVNTNGQSVPPARAGHTCNIWNSQIIVMGGYVGQDLTCDSPGIYIFDASTLQWKTQYVALEGANYLNQQDSQKHDMRGLSGSYGYKVPKAVQKVIGGDDQGRATVTKPATAATGGPMATGKPITYTVTNPDGSVTTHTSLPGQGRGGGPNVAAIAAGVVAGCLFILAIYLGFCIFVYRRQLALYKSHIAAVQRSPTSSRIALNGDKFGASFVPLSSSENTGSARHMSFSETGSNVTAAFGAGGGTQPGYRGFTGDFRPSSGPAGGLGSAYSSTDDLLAGQEPTFLGVMLNPRRSLRVINKD